jgi:hypothetical protein
MTENPKSILPKPIPVNPALVWDYEIPSAENQTDAFRKWYLARVLTRGNSADLRAIGLETIYVSLPSLNLPPAVRRFWEWYFSLPEVRAHYESADSLSTTDRRSHL